MRFDDVALDDHVQPLVGAILSGKPLELNQRDGRRETLSAARLRARQVDPTQFLEARP